MNQVTARPYAPDLYARAGAPQAMPAPAAGARPSIVGAPGADLSADEQTMIERFFPEQPALSLVLYGPRHASSSPPSQPLGARLDLRG